jgi:site-specific DNA-methyltransferase (adenine-specific)
MTAVHMETLAEGVTLYLGDCRDVLPTLGKVAHVITDPPYEREAHDPGRRLNGRTVELKDRRIREIDTSPIDFEPTTPELRSACAAEFGRLCGGWVLVFCQAEAVQVWRESLEIGGCVYRRAMVWIKPDSAPQLSGDRPAQGYESIVTAWAGESISTDCHAGVAAYFGAQATRQPDMFIEKPKPLIQEALNL